MNNIHMGALLSCAFSGTEAIKQQQQQQQQQHTIEEGTPGMIKKANDDCIKTASESTVLLLNMETAQDVQSPERICNGMADTVHGHKRPFLNGDTETTTKQTKLNGEVENRHESTSQQELPHCDILSNEMQNGYDADETCIHVNELPLQVLLHVFQYLSIPERLNASKVCDHWCDVTHNSCLWHRVNLRRNMKVTDIELLGICEINPAMVQLDIRDTKCVTADGFIKALSICKRLQKLDITRCYEFKEPVFLAIANSCPQMTHLQMQCCSYLTNETLSAIAEGCPNLKELFINQCTQITDEGIIALSQHSRNLATLNMDQCSKVTDRCLPELTQGCKDLTELSAMACAITDSGLKVLGRFAGLTSLEITNNRSITDNGICELLPQLAKLETLNLSLNHQITDKSAAAVARHGKNITKLYMISCRLTDKAMEMFSNHLVNLEMIDVGWCMGVTERGVELVSSRLKKLTSVGLMRCDYVSDDTMDELVETYPHITYSTKWLDTKKLILRAQADGKCLHIDLSQRIGQF